MDDLGALILGSPAPVMARGKLTPMVRDGDRKRILEEEYAAELKRVPNDSDGQGEVRKQANLESLRREHGNLPAPQAAVAPMTAPAADPLGAMIATPGRDTPMGKMPAPVGTGERAPTQPKRMAANPFEIVPQVAATALTGAGASIIGGFRGAAETFGRLASGESLASAREQGGAAASQYIEDHTFKPTTPYAETAVQAIGIPGAVVEKAADYLGEKATQATGSPAVGANIKAVGEMLPGAVLGKMMGRAPGKAISPPVEAPSIPAYKGGRSGARPPVEIPTEAAPVAGDIAVGVGAARSEMNQYAGKITGEESARGGPYPVVKLSKVANDVPHSEQATRAQIVSEIVPNAGVRTGVITGNENALRNEYTKANSPNRTPEGEGYRQQIAQEQNALSEYAQKRIENTGASPTLQDPYERGQRINDAFAGEEGLRGFFKSAKNEIYDQALKTVGDNPVTATRLEGLLGDPQFKAELKLKGISDFTNGLQELYNHHKGQGFENTKPGSLAGLDELRKSLNAQWTPANARAIGKVVRAIDEDIANAGGPGLYEQGRNLHEFEQKMFGSKGMKTLFGEINPLTGTQSATAFEGIPKKLNNMPFDEWRHVYDRADELAKGHIRFKNVELKVPEELRQAAEAAKAEMMGGIAREVYEAGGGKVGVWNQNAVNKVLNARSRQIKHAFSPEEQQAFHTLNYGGHIMPGVHSYEGAGLQGQRVGLIESKLPMAAKIMGAATRIPGAAYLAEKAGEKGAAKLSGGRLRKEAEAAQAAMQANKNLGKEGPYNEDMRRMP